MKLPASDDDGGGLNMTPIIDIVFLLLIYFLIAPRFDEEERELPTQLAEVAQAQPLASPPNEVIVNVSERGEFIVIGEKLSEKQLGAFLHALALKNPGTQRVQIRVDKRVPFEYPARVMGLCAQEKIEQYFTLKVATD
jgi:biopolymer transport protein ExbD